jgi:hypothetical protein
MSSLALRGVAAVAACVLTITVGASSMAAQRAPADSHPASHPALRDATPDGALVDVVVPVARHAPRAIAVPEQVALSGPRLAPVGLQAAVLAEASSPADADRDKNVSVGSNLALMGVGAAALVVGLLVGGDSGTVIAVGGGVVGLVGLYRYLR